MNATKEIVKKTEDSLIYVIRGQNVMLDEDLARVYGVETRRLNEQVKRNSERFPKDFMFQLTEKEYDNLMSQIATSSESPSKDVLISQNATSKKEGWGGRRKLPYVFTEHGTVMLASVLNSPKAVHASIQVVKAFVRLRELALAHKDIAKKLEALEQKYDKQFAIVFEAVRNLMSAPSKGERKRVGYRRKDE